MKQEFFTARLLQIQLEMEAVKSEIAGMQSRNAWRECNGGGEPDFGIFDFKVNADKLRSLQGDIKALMEEYSKGEEIPAVAETKPGTLASASGLMVSRLSPGSRK